MASFRAATLARSVSGVRDELQALGCSQQAPIACPQLAASGQSGGRKEMGVDVTDAEPVKRYDIDHALDFVVGCRGGGAKVAQRIQYGLAIAHAGERELADDERMNQHAFGFQQGRKRRIAGPNVVDPHLSVDKNHAGSDGRRGTDSRSGSVPPRRASRRALSRAINARSASLTSADFSVTPVNCCALASSASSSDKWCA